MSAASQIPELDKSGVYCLLGSEGAPPQAYVGQGAKKKDGGGVLKRVKKHDTPAKTFWNVALIFVDKNKNLGSTEIDYLEYRFHEMATAANKYSLTNKKQPAPGVPGAAVVLSMNGFFIPGVEVVTEALGYKVFVRNTLPPPPPSYTLSCKVGGVWSIKATGVALPGGKKFRVLAGSQLAPLQDKKYSIGKDVKEKRLAHCRQNAVSVLSHDVDFDSSSAAARFVTGSSVSGTKGWQ